jgi:hypothetical protein
MNNTDNLVDDANNELTAEYAFCVELSNFLESPAGKKLAKRVEANIQSLEDKLKTQMLNINSGKDYDEFKSDFLKNKARLLAAREIQNNYFDIEALDIMIKRLHKELTV